MEVMSLNKIVFQEKQKKRGEKKRLRVKGGLSTDMVRPVSSGLSSHLSTGLQASPAAVP